MRYFPAVFAVLISSAAMAQTAPKPPAPTIASLEAQVQSLERALKQCNQVPIPNATTTTTPTAP